MSSTFVIAEVGVNHNGSLVLAKKLIDVAVKARADAVKFQTYKTENLVTKSAAKANYQTNNDKNDDNQFTMLKKYELTLSDHLELLNYCQNKSIEFLSSPFDIDSLNLLLSLPVKKIKLGSGEITNYPLLKAVASNANELILSTGMANLDEVGAAMQALQENGMQAKQVTLLQANTQYPSPLEDVNLKAMLTLGQTFNTRYGYSDHTAGIEASLAAVALGASVIEKHITLDNNMEGPDHLASMEPQAFVDFVTSIRKVEKSLGNAVKQPSNSEKENIIPARKSIVAKIAIKKGEILNEENITTKRPATGISPMRWDEIIGTVASKDYQADEVI